MLDWFRRRWTRLAIPLAAFAVVYAAYLFTHQFPALNGGLYVAMTRQIAESGYGIPAVVPYYTEGGIPFGFPPLGFYVAAVLLELGLSVRSLTLLFPVVPFALALVVFYAFAERLLEDGRMATLAAVVLATSAPVLQYTISAGGFVRATALLFTVLGLYAGLRSFQAETWAWPWLLATALFTGLTALTHPKYILFLGTSLVVLAVRFDLSVRGATKSAAVLAGGFALAAPWWANVVATHGVGLLVEASRTHGGIGNPFWFFGFLLPVTSPTDLWPVLVVLAGIYLVAQGRLFMPLWMFASGVVVHNDEYAMLVGALMIATVVYEGVVPAIEPDGLRAALGLPWSVGDRTVTSSAIAAGFFTVVLVTYATGSAVLYVEDGLLTDDEFISFVDDEDLEAMDWVQQNTDTAASFVVVGDTAEWFPVFAERTSLVAARGSAWEGVTQRNRMLSVRVALSGCLAASCVTQLIEDNGLNPEYVYVARDGYIRGNNRDLTEERWEFLRPSLDDDPAYTLEYQNDGVVVYRYEADDATQLRTPPVTSQLDSQRGLIDTAASPTVL